MDADYDTPPEKGRQRNHLLATYLIVGFVVPLVYAVS